VPFPVVILADDVISAKAEIFVECGRRNSLTDKKIERWFLFVSVILERGAPKGAF
jgi:hypothetical protein